MKMIIYLLLSTAMLLTGCNGGSENTDSDGEANLNVSFVCHESETVDLNSRVLNPQQEKNISDVNVYMFHKLTGVCKRQYLSGVMSFSMPLTFGVWDIYVIANRGSDLGSLSKQQVENLNYSITSESDIERNSVMPMSGYQEVSISSNISVNITLKRIVAKVDVSVKVANNLDIKISSIRLVNAPTATAYFKPNTPTEGLIEYPYNIFSGGNISFYMLENRQGVNNKIYSQNHKGGPNAPKYGAYLCVEAAGEGKIMEYRIYLGENNTTDFNVIANKNYSLDINILGTHSADWRVIVKDLALNVEVSIATAQRTITQYYPEMTLVGVDHVLEVSVKLSNPSYYRLIVPISGVSNIYGTKNIISAEYFYPSPYVIIQPGQTSGSIKLHKELRNSWSEEDMLFDELYINSFITDPSDNNKYYTSDYFHVYDVREYVYEDYPID